MENIINSKLEENINKGCDFIFNKLYYPKTKMIYDFLYTENMEDATDIFPTPDEIQHSVPNPCGWGTGMEDATLNLGTMLEATENRFKATGDIAMKKYFDMMCEGLITTGTVAPEKGFIARCVAPCDGKSIYIDSSRDQYTHWVFAGHVILNSELADDDQKETVKEVLVNIARKAERDVTEENGGYMLRLDGKKGRVSQMMGKELGPHELQRLPMIYAAAYEASKDNYWLAKYHKIRDELLIKAENNYTAEFCRNVAENFGYVYGSYQAQYSLRLLYDIESDENYKKRYLKLMQTVAESSEISIDKAYANIDLYNWEQPFYPHWRNISAAYFGYGDGYGYYVPSMAYGESESLEKVRKNLRNTGETFIIMCLCPEYKISDDLKEKFAEIIEKTNFNNIKSYWPVVICGAFYALNANEAI